MTHLKKPLCRFERIKIVNFKRDDFDIADKSRSRLTQLIQFVQLLQIHEF